MGLEEGKTDGGRIRTAEYPFTRVGTLFQICRQSDSKYDKGVKESLAFHLKGRPNITTGYALRVGSPNTKLPATLHTPKFSHCLKQLLSALYTHHSLAHQNMASDEESPPSRFTTEFFSITDTAGCVMLQDTKFNTNLGRKSHNPTTASKPFIFHYSICLLDT